MKRFSGLIILALIMISSTLFAQQDQNLQQLQVDVVYLSSDLLAGRETGTMGEAMAAAYIAHRFDEIGLKPGADGNWYQNFDFVFKTNPHAAEGVDRVGKNVLGWLDRGAERTVVIGAHYDHLGHGSFGSRHTGEPAIHNGADDNASGVAMMLYLAEQLVDKKDVSNNYLFIAFSGEELGLYGSKAFVRMASLDMDKINYMLNFDMVGRLNEEQVVVLNGTGTSPSWKLALEAIDKQGLSFKMNDSGIGPSDHTSFYLEDIPVLHFFTGQHNDYHKPEDDSELINYKGMYTIGTVCEDLINHLSKKGELAFTKTKDESEGRKVAKFKVSLGVMPDYVYQGEGMRIDGVLDDRPAQKAGLEKGDVIVKIGDMDIKDIYDYMEGLSKFEAGDKTTIVVMRDKKKIKSEVEF